MAGILPNGYVFADGEIEEIVEYGNRFPEAEKLIVKAYNIDVIVFRKIMADSRKEEFNEFEELVKVIKGC